MNKIKWQITKMKKIYFWKNASVSVVSHIQKPKANFGLKYFVPQ